MTQPIINFLIGPFLTWLPIVAFFIIAILASVIYFLRNYPEKAKKITNYKFLIIFTIVFKTLYALLYSFGYYYVWSGEAVSEVLLNSPLNSNVPPSIVTKLFPTLFASDLGYFFYYVYGRFFINLFLAVGIAYAFWAFLRFLKKYKDRFFEAGETELGLLCALIVGWPNFLVFIPIVFLSIIIVSILRGIFLKEAYTTMGWPFLLATFVCLIAGNWLIQILNLSVFRI